MDSLLLLRPSALPFFPADIFDQSTLFLSLSCSFDLSFFPFLFISHSVCLSVCLFVVFVCLSVFLSSCFSVCLSLMHSLSPIPLFLLPYL